MSVGGTVKYIFSPSHTYDAVLQKYPKSDQSWYTAIRIGTFDNWKQKIHKAYSKAGGKPSTLFRPDEVHH